MKKEAPAAQDYHCVLCGTLPRTNGPCRSETYKHYSLRHFSNQLRDNQGRPGKEYKECGMALSPRSWLAHTGQVQGHVEAYLPKEAMLAVVPRKANKSAP